MKTILLVLSMVVSVSAFAGNNGEYALEQAKQDGCSSGNRDGGDWTSAYRKDVDAYINNPYYKEGWETGYRSCKAFQDKIHGAIQQSFGGW